MSLESDIKLQGYEATGLARHRSNSTTGSYFLALSQVRDNIHLKGKKMGTLTSREHHPRSEDTCLVIAGGINRHTSSDKMAEIHKRLINLKKVYPKIRMLEQRAIQQYHGIAKHMGCIVCPNCKKLVSERTCIKGKNPHVIVYNNVDTDSGEINYECHYRTYNQRLTQRHSNHDHI